MKCTAYEWLHILSGETILEDEVTMESVQMNSALELLLPDRRHFWRSCSSNI